MLIPLHMSTNWLRGQQFTFITSVVTLALLTIFAQLIYPEQSMYARRIEIIWIQFQIKNSELNDSWDLNFLVFTQCQSINFKAAHVYSNNNTDTCHMHSHQLASRWQIKEPKFHNKD